MPYIPFAMHHSRLICARVIASVALSLV